MELSLVTVDKPEALNIVLGQTHFIKTVEDIHEALVTAVPAIRFGLAFCEASGKCLVRGSGTDPALQELALRNAQAMERAGAGRVVVETELAPERLAAEILQFADEPKRLVQMGKRARALGRPGATAAIVDLVEEVARA